MTLPSLEQFLEERLNWFERLRRPLSPTDEYLFYMCVALEQLVRLQGGALPPYVPPSYDELIAAINAMKTSVDQLIVVLGGQAPIQYQLEQVRREPVSAISAGSSEIIWRTKETVEQGSVAYIKLVSDIEDVRYRIIVDDSAEIIYDASELNSYSIEHPHPMGAWIEKANGSFVVLIAGWGFEGFRYNKRFILAAQNRHATSTLNITLMELLRRKVV